MSESAAFAGRIGRTLEEWTPCFPTAHPLPSSSRNVVITMHRPDGIRDRGTIRTRYHHVVDVVPTILNALKLEPPISYRGVDQVPLRGISMACRFDAADAPTRKTVRYFEMLGNRGIRNDG